MSEILEREIKVTFLVAGTQKGGTAALDNYLRSHEQICMAKDKEVHFFDNEALFERGGVDYSHYHAYFKPAASARMLGEATPIYMYWYAAPRRIWEYNPEMKFIVILRNPIKRAFSHWNMLRDMNMETLSFWEAIRTERARCREALPLQHRHYSYIDRGFYTEQLRRILHFFPSTSVLALKQEDMRRDPRTALGKVCSFLGVTDCCQQVSAEIVNARSYERPMTEKEFDCLATVFEYEIRELERMLGWDCSEWMNLSGVREGGEPSGTVLENL